MYSIDWLQMSLRLISKLKLEENRSSEKLEKKQIEQKNSKNNVDSLLSNITEWIFKFFNRWIICWALRNR